MNYNENNIIDKAVMQTNIFNKNEFPVNRGTIKQCEECNRAFSVFLREHQCKRCFRAVCNDCGSNQHLVYKIGYTRREHRVCKKCKGASEYIAKFIQTNKLKFGTLSELGEKWFKKIIKRPRLKGEENSKQKLFTK